MNEFVRGPEISNRHSTRLWHHGYTGTAAYFVTFCCAKRERLFGQIARGVMGLSPLGEIVQREWERSPEIRKEIFLDEYVVMPDHFHAVIWIEEQDAADNTAPFRRPKSLGSLIAGFKAATSSAINKIRNMPGMPVWQRNYHDRVIRNEPELNRIRAYIRQNPARWRRP